MAQEPVTRHHVPAHGMTYLSCDPAKLLETGERSIVLWFDNEGETLKIAVPLADGPIIRRTISQAMFQHKMDMNNGR